MIIDSARKKWGILKKLRFLIRDSLIVDSDIKFTRSLMLLLLGVIAAGFEFSSTEQRISITAILSSISSAYHLAVIMISKSTIAKYQRLCFFVDLVSLILNLIALIRRFEGNSMKFSFNLGILMEFFFRDCNLPYIWFFHSFINLTIAFLFILFTPYEELGVSSSLILLPLLFQAAWLTNKKNFDFINNMQNGNHAKNPFEWTNLFPFLFQKEKIIVLSLPREDITKFKINNVYMSIEDKFLKWEEKEEKSRSWLYGEDMKIEFFDDGSGLGHSLEKQKKSILNFLESTFVISRKGIEVNDQENTKERTPLYEILWNLLCTQSPVDIMGGDALDSISKKYKCLFVKENDTMGGQDEELPLKVRVCLFNFSGKVFLIIRSIQNTLRTDEKLASNKTEECTFFLASLVHDLRSPLIALEYLLDNLSSGEDNSEKIKTINMAKSNSKLLSFLVDDIMDFSVSQNKNIRLSLSFFSISRLIQETLDIMRPISELRNIDLFYDNSLPIEFKANSDPRRIKQVLINLISNAIKFTVEGSVRIKALVLDDYLTEFHVIDSGVGIKKENLKNIAVPFNTIDNEKGLNKRGTGLGLYNCNQILSHLGPGQLQVTSEEGIGSDFSFQIYRDVHHPRSQFIFSEPSHAEFMNRRKNNKKLTGLHFRTNVDEYDRFSIRTEVEMSQRVLNVGIKRPQSVGLLVENFMPKNWPSFLSILVVDDNPFNLLIMERYLKAVTKIEIKHENCVNGAQAVELFKSRNKPLAEEPFHLIFLDIQLPIKNGFEVAEEIAKYVENEDYRKPSVYGMTAIIEENYHQRALETKMKRILLRPFGIDEVQKVCEECVITRSTKRI